MKSDTSSLIARAKSNPVLTVLAFALVVLFVLMGMILYKLFADSQRDQEYLNHLAELRASTFRLSSLTRDATSGNEQAFSDLQGVVASMDTTWHRQKPGISS